MSNKAYQTAVSWNNDTLVLTLSGLSSKQNADEIAQTVARICLETKPAKLLVDCRNLKGRLGIFDTYRLFKDYPLNGKSIVPRIAVVDLPENREQLSFYETEARNRGLDLLNFATEAEAVAWLNASAAD
jgi:hypothetical protein